MCWVKIVSLVVLSCVFIANSQTACFCGESHSSGLDTCDSKFNVRIAGGEVAEINEFPWAALLEIRDGNVKNGKPFRCGGTLVNDRLLLSKYLVFSGNMLTNDRKFGDTVYVYM